MNKIEVVYGNYSSIDLSEITIGLEELAQSYKRVGKISYYLLSDDELLEVNKTHLNHDYYTDIITFDYSTASKLNGEIYISVDRVLDNGREGFEMELIRVLSHGILHMLGFKDKEPDEIMEMRRKEEEWINIIVSRES